MSTTCQRCYKVVSRACQSEVEWEDCPNLQRNITMSEKERAYRAACFEYAKEHETGLITIKEQLRKMKEAYIRIYGSWEKK